MRMGSSGLPTQEYHCNADGPFDIHLSFADDVPTASPCPECGGSSRHVLRAPAGGAHFSRTWNEQANEYQRDPYTQAKAQSWNNYNEKRDMGIRLDKPNEKGLQIASKAIDDESRSPRPSAPRQQKYYTRRLAQQDKEAKAAEQRQ
jgi:hypothetical protein